MGVSFSPPCYGFSSLIPSLLSPSSLPSFTKKKAGGFAPLLGSRAVRTWFPSTLKKTSGDVRRIWTSLSYWLLDNYRLPIWMNKSTNWLCVIYQNGRHLLGSPVFKCSFWGPGQGNLNFRHLLFVEIPASLQGYQTLLNIVECHHMPPVYKPTSAVAFEVVLTRRVSKPCTCRRQFFQSWQNLTPLVFFQPRKHSNPKP